MFRDPGCPMMYDFVTRLQYAVILSLGYAGPSRGWTCRYETDGALADTGEIFGNRNGHYRLFEARAKDRLRVHVTIKEDQTAIGTTQLKD